MYLVKTNSTVRPGIRYVTRERAEARRPAWERHYAEAGLALETFEVVPFDVMNPAHYYKAGRTLIVQAEGSADFADAKVWDRRTNRWAVEATGKEAENAQQQENI
jgi:hypothetical protein